MTTPDTTFSPSPSAAPGELNALLPQTISGVFDEAFDLYKRHFSTLALIVGLAYLPVQILSQTLWQFWGQPLFLKVVNASDKDTDFLAILQLILAYSLVGVLFFLVLVLVSGPVCVAISEIYLGKTPSVKSAFRQAASSFWRVFGGWLLLVLASIGVGMVMVLIAFFILGIIGLAFGNAMPILLTILTVIFVFFIPYLAITAVIAQFGCFMVPLVVLERLSLSDVPTRNGQLVGKKRFLRTWGAIFFLPILTYGLQILIGNSLESVMEATHVTGAIQFLCATASNTTISLFLQPYWMIFSTLLYYDYRIRREGFDVRLLSTDMPVMAPSLGAIPAPVMPFDMPAPMPLFTPYTAPPMSEEPTVMSVPIEYPDTSPSAGETTE